MLPLVAAIPFFELRVYNVQLGSTTVPIDPWATFVCIGFVLGLEMARYRGIRLGLDVRDVVDGALFIVGMGFLVAHVVTVLFYFPERLTEEGVISLLKVWEGFSSTGGFLGAVVGAWLFYGLLRKRPALRHADVICFGFPFGWFFGRLGCASVHDHLGSKTNFFLGMEFPPSHFAAGVRHELGLYEAMYMVPVMALFLYLGRQDRIPGFFLAVFALTYAPVRFVLDFLRNTDLEHQDLRWAGMTPAQYGMIVLFVAVAGLLWWLRKQPFEPLAMDGTGRTVAVASSPPPPPEPAPAAGDPPP